MELLLASGTNLDVALEECSKIFNNKYLSSVVLDAKKENGNTPPEVVIKTKPEWVKSSLANKSKYQQKYSQSIKSNDEFWRKEGKRITWIKPYKKINYEIWCGM